MHAAGRAAAVRGGIFFKLLLALTVLGAMTALAWMLLLPWFVTGRLRERTGFDVEVRSLMVNPFTGRIAAQGLVVKNPPTFPRTEFIEARALEIEADLFTLFTAKPVLQRVKIDLARLALVKRADGRTNAEVFQSYLLEDRPSPGRSATPRPPLLIRRLEVKFDRFVLADHTRREPVVRDYAVNLDRTFENVTDTRQLLLPASLDQLFALGGALGSLLPAEVARALDDAARSGTDAMRELTRRNPAIFGGFTDTLEESKKP
jgi:hypothetical protein